MEPRNHHPFLIFAGRFALVCLGIFPGTASGQPGEFQAPDSVCVGTAVTLTDLTTGGTTYSWSFYGNACGSMPAVNSTLFTPPPFTYAAIGVYYIVLVVDAGLPTQASYCRSITVLGPPTVNLGADTTFCQYNPCTLQGPVYVGASYAWNNGSDSSTTVADTSGKFWLTLSYYGCMASDTILCTATPTPVIHLPSDTVLCDSGVLHYQSALPVTYVWNTGSIADTTLVPVSGYYWLQLNYQGCVSPLDTVYCTVISSHSVQLGPDTGFCGPGVFHYVYSDTGHATYQWSTGSDSTGTPIPATGQYFLTVTDRGCKSTDSIECTVVNQVSVNLPADTLFCDSGLLKYASPVPVTYQWSTGSTGDSTEVTQSGNYNLQVQIGTSTCTAQASVQATVHATPLFYLPADTTFCGQGTLRYSGMEPVTYQWNTGATTDSIVAGSPGQYQLQADNQGCTAVAATQVSIKPAPQVNLGRDTAVCFIWPYVLDAGNPGSTYLWQDGSSGETDSAAAPGEYSVAVTENGCTTVDSVALAPARSPTFSVNGDRSICPGERIVLVPTNDSLTYTWQGESPDSEYAVTGPGTYYVNGTNGCNSATDTVSIVPGVCTVHVPGAFTPNGDGINDVLKVLGVELVNQFSLQIFNRWGQPVYQSEDKDGGWDGTTRGVPQPVGTYIYRLTFKYQEGQPYEMGGTVILIR